MKLEIYGIKYRGDSIWINILVVEDDDNIRDMVCKFLRKATAINNIILSMNISGISGVDKKARSLDLLKKVGISPEKANRKILKLSGGEQQHVCIARALSHNPDLIIADEVIGIRAGRLLSGKEYLRNRERGTSCKKSNPFQTNTPSPSFL